MIGWIKSLFRAKPHVCLFREADVWFYDDPKCVKCGKSASEAAKEKGIDFITKSPKSAFDELIDRV